MNRAAIEYIVAQYKGAYDISLKRVTTLSTQLYSEYGEGLDGEPFVLLTCASKMYNGGYFFRISKNGVQRNYLGAKRENRETRKKEMIWENCNIR